MARTVSLHPIQRAERQAEAVAVLQQHQWQLREQERLAQTASARKKWIADAQIVAALVNELDAQYRLSQWAFDLQPEPQLVFQDTGADGAAIATAAITGQLLGRAVDIRLEIDGDGFLSIATTRPNMGYLELQFESSGKISVLAATKCEYEQLVLDALRVIL